MRKLLIASMWLTASLCQALAIQGTLVRGVAGMESGSEEHYLAIQTATPAKTTFPNGEVAETRKIQLIGLSDASYRAASLLVGKEVSAEGNLFPPETQHHHTTILLMTEQVRPAGDRIPRESAKRKTITDYFLALPPAEFLEGTPAQLTRRAQAGGQYGTVDTKNGYMFVQGDGAQVNLQIALFRYADGRPLLAVAYGDLEERDFSKLVFFVEEGNQMIPAEIQTPFAHEPMTFTLPQYGRTIQAKNPAGLTATASWKNDRFTTP